MSEVLSIFDVDHIWDLAHTHGRFIWTCDARPFAARRFDGDSMDELNERVSSFHLAWANYDDAAVMVRAIEDVISAHDQTGKMPRGVVDEFRHSLIEWTAVRDEAEQALQQVTPGHASYRWREI